MEVNLKILNIEDRAYPESLREIYNPPKKLYVMGDERILNNFGIAIVGTRNVTPYGKRVTREICL